MKTLAFETLLVVLLIVAKTHATPNYTIVPLGLTGPEHTSLFGYKYSLAKQLNEAGQVIGYSNRYNGGDVLLGFSAWLYDGATTIDIGLTGPEHTLDNGSKYSQPEQLNNSGQVIGFSSRFNGGQTAWLYNGMTTIGIGLTGPEHIRNDGYRDSYVHDITEYGQVLGSSARYIGLSYQMGRSMWVYNGTSTIDIGLIGAEHTHVNGYKYSVAPYSNEAGHVAGYSNRFNGGSDDLGFSAWIYDGVTTIEIGLTGPEHTANNDTTNNLPFRLNKAGYVIGYASRFNSGSVLEDLGQSAWLYNGTTTIDVGLTGTEHTRGDAYKYSVSGQLSETGHVIGHSRRYNGGSADLGFSAWLYDGATTIDIGLTGPEHTRNDGYKESSPHQVNEADQVIGYSRRYNGGSAELGFSAWLYDGATTIDIGLISPEHTRNDGFRYSEPGQLFKSGQIIGYADRYNGGSVKLGNTLWRYNGTTTIHMGFTGPEYTRSDGYKHSGYYQLNDAGHVTGVSYRYNGGGLQLGQSAWLHDGVTTVEIGLTGPEHTRDDGLKHSAPLQLNEKGQVVGESYRYNGLSDWFGNDGWFYDPGLNQTFILQLSTRSDGFANSSVSYLGDDGLVLGSYTLFDDLDNDLGSRAFYFTITGGLHDLGGLVKGGLLASGWDSLANAIRVNGVGQILGYGSAVPYSGGPNPYLLTPTIPEPGTAALIFLRLLAFFAHRSPKHPKFST